MAISSAIIPKIKGREIAAILQLCRDSMYGHALADQSDRLKIIWKNNIGSFSEDEFQLFSNVFRSQGVE